MNAKDYKKLASAKRVVFDVEVPSGGMWKLLEPPLKQFIAAGRLPAALAAKMTAIAQSNQGQDALAAQKAAKQALTPDDLIQALAFGRDLLLHCAVEPRISLNADPESETEIAPEDILPEDFEFLSMWVITGGKSGEGLDTFRDEGPQPAVAGSNES